MNEDGMWNALRPRLAQLGLDPQRIENVAGEGTPDVNYSDGMIELKYLAKWPVRANTPVIIPKLVERKHQAAWLYTRWTRGGAAWLLLRVHHDLLLFSGYDVPTIRKGVTRSQMFDLACWYALGGERLHHTDAHWHRLAAWLRQKEANLPPHACARLLRLRCYKPVDYVATEMEVPVADVVRGETTDCQMSSDLIEFWTC